MKIRLKTTVPSMFHGVHGLTVGDEVEVDDDNAQRYISIGVAEAVSESDVPQGDTDVVGVTEDGVALVHPEDRAGDLPVNPEALDPDAVVNDNPLSIPVPLDEDGDEDGDKDGDDDDDDDDESESEEAAAEGDSKPSTRTRTRVRDTRRRNR